ncbi:aminotransferase yhxA [Bacillus benzoevorans]|uniref:Aminotransferase yhxA n=1 Tax=Bacillus benzoevorans TaxID=1456 RepID=A0A7X0HQS9_9BACI|nr:aminotransferase yhxA [Bacillus benzoevorans]MBB6443915.1 hypothetical protein [Bacillus benzoevorans]
MSKTKLLLTGIVSAAVIIGVTNCSNNSSQPKMPDDPSCDDWEWDDDDGVWECDDEYSSHYGHSYHGGKYYSSKSNLYKDSSYKSYKSSSSFKSSSSGFGSGSKGGFGG